MSFYFELGLFLVALLVALAILKLFKDPKLVLWNSALGVATFLILDVFLGLGIPINIVTIAIVAVGGFGGVLFVLLFHFLGLAF